MDLDYPLRWKKKGCAFEILIGFNGGLGGNQTSPFLLHPV